eukprot:1119576-Pleurochrysis_carterae.AAC.3
MHELELARLWSLARPLWRGSLVFGLWCSRVWSMRLRQVVRSEEAHAVATRLRRCYRAVAATAADKTFREDVPCRARALAAGRRQRGQCQGPAAGCA